MLLLICIHHYQFGCKINLNHEKTQKDLSKNDLAIWFI